MEQCVHKDKITAVLQFSPLWFVWKNAEGMQTESSAVKK